MLRPSIFMLNFTRKHSKLIRQMKTHSVVPDVIDCPPHKLLKILYDGSLPISPGSTIKPSQTEFEPLLQWTCDPKTYHVICMTDPDSPNRSSPTLKELHHWLVGNVVGCKQTTGKTLSEYIPCGPPEGTGLHRFVFLVYRQKDLINFEEPFLAKKFIKPRVKFSINKFAEKYDLGNPVAGNFFFAEYDAFVAKLYKTFRD